MKKYTVITTFHQAGLELYGQKMIDSFEQHWPDDVDLVIYAENCDPVVKKPNVRVVDLLAVSKSCKRFVKRHANNPRAHGNPNPGVTDDITRKKAFRWQATRFCYKVFATGHAANTIDTDWLIWLDGDTHTHSSVPESFLPTVCPDSHLISYLGRGERYHSECGWVAYNMQDPMALQFINRFVGMYNSDEIFQHKEWHDSFIWDVVRREMVSQGANFYDLNPQPDTKGLAGHPFINSELGRYMDHKKGDRKQRGHSKAKEVVSHPDHPYWQKVLGR